MSRESLARAVNSSNLKQQDQHCTLDDLHALGLSAIHNPIGSETIHFIDGLQAKSYQQLIYLLAKRANTKFSLKSPQTMTISICRQVVREAAFKFCHTCSGRKEIKAGERVIICHSCQGSGLHRHTDLERASSIGVNLDIYLKHWQRRFRIAEQILNDELKSSLVRVKNLMETY